VSGEEALKAAFDRAFELPPGTDHESLAYRGHERWDSLGHMVLVAELEQTFDVMLETDDVLDLTSYPVARDMLRRLGADL
jgi:acyl carrier protein